MSVLFNRVLVALPEDLNLAETTANRSMAVAQTHSAAVRLLSVIPPKLAPATAIGGPSPVDTTIDVTPKVSEEALQNRRKVVQTILDKHTPRDPADQSVRFGNPADQILEEAAEWEADLIVLGAHDRGWLERLFDPPTNEKVARRANCAVLIFPESTGD